MRRKDVAIESKEQYEDIVQRMHASSVAADIVELAETIDALREVARAAKYVADLRDNLNWRAFGHELEIKRVTGPLDALPEWLLE